MCKIATQQARAHHKRKVLQECLVRWQQHTKYQKEYATMRLQAARFWLRNRYSQTILAWREWVLEHRRMRTAAALAVRHWSIRVRWNVWVAWKAYTQHKREGMMHKAALMYKAHVTKAGMWLIAV